MNYETSLYVVMVGTGALALVTFLVETILLDRLYPWLSCLLVGVGLSIGMILMGHEWIINHPDEWYQWETISNGDPWPFALSRLVLLLCSASGPFIMIWKSFQMRTSERREQDRQKRLMTPRSIRENWN